MKTIIARHDSAVPSVAELGRQVIGPADVRVSVAAAAFTYFDGFVAANGQDLGLPDPVGLGFDFSGTVTELGHDVTGFVIGDRVAGLHVDITAPIRAHSEEIVIDAQSIALVPADLDLEVAAAVPLTALTARQALDLVAPSAGELMVTGAAGAIGGWLIELATREGWRVTALVRPGTEGLVEAETVITALTGSYDAVVDAAGLHGVALAAVRDGGRYVGFKPNQAQQAERGIDVHTVQVVPDGDVLADLLATAAKGEIPVRIAGRRPLAEAAEAYALGASESGSQGRWLLLP